MATIIVKSHIAEVKSQMADNQQKFAEIVGSMCEDYVREKIMRGYDTLLWPNPICYQYPI